MDVEFPCNPARCWQAVTKKSNVFYIIPLDVGKREQSSKSGHAVTILAQVNNHDFFDLLTAGAVH